MSKSEAMPTLKGKLSLGKVEIGTSLTDEQVMNISKIPIIENDVSNNKMSLNRKVNFLVDNTSGIEIQDVDTKLQEIVDKVIGNIIDDRLGESYTKTWSISNIIKKINEYIGDFIGSSTSIFNVDNYGAIGDGVTDDTKAFQDCYAAMKLADGGIFKLGECKKYKITQGISVLYNDFTDATSATRKYFIFDGQGSHILNYGVTPAFFFSGERGKNVNVNQNRLQKIILRDITIDCIDRNKDGIVLLKMTDFLLDNVVCINCNYGLQGALLSEGVLNKYKAALNNYGMYLDGGIEYIYDDGVGISDSNDLSVISFNDCVFVSNFKVNVLLNRVGSLAFNNGSYVQGGNGATTNFKIRNDLNGGCCRNIILNNIVLEDTTESFVNFDLSNKLSDAPHYIELYINNLNYQIPKGYLFKSMGKSQDCGIHIYVNGFNGRSGYTFNNDINDYTFLYLSNIQLLPRLYGNEFIYKLKDVKNVNFVGATQIYKLFEKSRINGATGTTFTHEYYKNIDTVELSPTSLSDKAMLSFGEISNKIKEILKYKSYVDVVVKVVDMAISSTNENVVKFIDTKGVESMVGSGFTTTETTQYIAKRIYNDFNLLVLKTNISNTISFKNIEVYVLNDTVDSTPCNCVVGVPQEGVAETLGKQVMNVENGTWYTCYKSGDSYLWKTM